MKASPLRAKPSKPRARRCKICGKPFIASRPLQRACSPACAIESVERAKRAKAAAAARLDRVETKAKLEKSKTRSDRIKEAQTAFNKYIRLRAIRFGHACISSGAPLRPGGVGGGFDCGHYRSIGSAPHLRFNLNNAWGQAKQDNRYGAGASFEYRRGLIARRGIEVVEALEANNTVRKFDIEYLKRIIVIFKNKARRMERRMKC